MACSTCICMCFIYRDATTTQPASHPPPSQPSCSTTQSAKLFHHPVSQAVPPPSQPAAPPPTHHRSRSASQLLHHPVSQLPLNPINCLCCLTIPYPAYQKQILCGMRMRAQYSRGLTDMDSSSSDDDGNGKGDDTMGAKWVNQVWYACVHIQSFRYVIMTSQCSASYTCTNCTLESWYFSIKGRFLVWWSRVCWHQSNYVWTIKCLETCFWAAWYSSDWNGSEMFCFSTQTVDKTLGWCMYIST